LAKKDNGKKKKDPEAGKKQQSRGDAVRAAAAQAIEATAGQAGFTRERAQQIADELVAAAGRFRETLEELRPAGSDEIAALRERIETLEARVQTLEAARATPRRRTTPAKRTPAKPAPATPPAATPPPDTPPPDTPPAPATPPPASST
jgi:polyhydroxyalkanoate synthesis regulator phasin